MMSSIEQLWENYQLPIRNALHFSRGASFKIELSPADSAGYKILEEFDLESDLSLNPDWVSDIDGLCSVVLDGGDLLWAGEGSYGSEGFVARLNREKSLIWTVFLEESNPFQEIHLQGSTACFVSTSGVRLRVNIDNPLLGALRENAH
ncbi:hypothetical protein [Streptomyces sp. NBC_00385]|uniref:hypothetical protein n=1 Tax=Streptomyces sp. NBC_00385 TaxID=2975733 RepID=UPI002DD9D218|nr:hypothetical protein [Streptomyces sp. NBC_00385]WRZ02384.1 hypothetical protein OG959_03025 [Streptomyces sp. NBC_00385]